MNRKPGNLGNNPIFLRAFFSELLGRYCNLLAFVEQSRLEAKGRSPYLFDAYGAELRLAIRELWDYGIVMKNSLPYAGTAPRDLLEAFDFLSDSSTRFQHLHRALRSFATPWPETAVSQFLRQLFQENGLAKYLETLHPTIVYSDEFNFLKYDLRDDLYLPKDSSPLAVWALPKAESNNPLLWPVLAHEIAHSLFSDDDVFEEVNAEIQRCFPAKQYAQLRHWSVEFNADYFAYRLLGPAYVCSLIYFCTFFLETRLRDPISIDQSLASHPPPHGRITFLMMELAGAKVPEGSQLLFDNLSGIYDARLAFDHAAGYHRPDEGIEIENLQPLWDSVKLMQHRVLPEIPSLAWSPEEMEEGLALSRQLDKGLLAASIGDQPKRAELRKTIGALANRLSGDSGDIDSILSEFKKSKEAMALNERPARMAEIVNGGWMANISQMVSGSVLEEYVKSVFHNGDPLHDDSTKHYKILGRQLQKSIQVALILTSLSEQRS